MAEDLAPGSLGASLIPWVKSFDDAGATEGWHDLSDGRTLWAILRTVDTAHFTGTLPEPEVGASGDWTRKWQNLRFVDKQVATYYRDVCNGQDEAGAGAIPDLKAIAADASPPDLERFIMIIIRAAMASPESNQRMAQRLMSLGREHAMVIATELRNMEEFEGSDPEPVSEDESSFLSDQEKATGRKEYGNSAGGETFTDPLLEREEELLQAQATIDKLQANQAAAQIQLQELRLEKEQLQEAFDVYRSEIDTKRRKPAGGEDNIQKLQRQAENDRAYIDDLESQMQLSRETVENYEKQLERHRADGETTQKLKDDLQLLRTENEDLGQKVKANENLKKKIQNLQEFEKTSGTLREELKQANERLEDLDRMKQVQGSLEKEIIEKKGLIRNQEYQINELTTTRKHAEYEARVLAQKLEAARERHDRDHESLEDLRRKLQDENLDDTELDDTSQEPVKQASEHEVKMKAPNTDESKHLNEKVILLEQQLEAADVRLKQASQRNAILEEQNRGIEADTAARQEAERQASEYEHTIAELRKELETSTNQRAPAPPQDVAALQRENHLMATAWYDLSSRLQHNGVSLGRRQQEPKSWIGKQRAVVGPRSSMQHHR